MFLNKLKLRIAINKKKLKIIKIKDNKTVRIKKP
jgi:hypothetical protein